jgi:hypothetical protein
MKKILTLCLFATIFGQTFIVNADENKKIIIGDFSNNKLQKWEEKTFKGNSKYELQKQDGELVLGASSSGTASALFYSKDIDLSKTPFLSWRWKIQNKLDTKDETVKSGDDYAARIYVVRDGGLFIWKTIAINYVWSNQQKQFSVWNNAFAGKNAKMLSLRDNTAKTNQWYQEKRNILEDFKKLYPDEDVTEIDGIALMVDTDNTKTTAKSFFGDIIFSSE